MNSHEAKEILALYRPGTDDAGDPDFSEALSVCERDPELKAWFEQYLEAQASIRARFRDIQAPDGLKEQILSERNSSTTAVRKPAMLVAAVAFVVVVVLGIFLLGRNNSNDLASFQNRMVSTALRTYVMDIETRDLEQIRKFLSTANSVSDYTVPSALQKAAGVGAVALNWRGRPVSMICFHSGRPLDPGEKSDLFLFVTDRSSIPGGTPSSPQISHVNRATLATWSDQKYTYVLVADGNEPFIREYL